MEGAKRLGLRSYSGFCQVSRLLVVKDPAGLGGLQNEKGYRGPAHVVQTWVCGGNMLPHARSDAQETSGFIERTRKPPR
jgi:hypothetical protein